MAPCPQQDASLVSLVVAIKEEKDDEPAEPAQKLRRGQNWRAHPSGFRHEEVLQKFRDLELKCANRKKKNQMDEMLETMGQAGWKLIREGGKVRIVSTRFCELSIF